MQSYEQLGNFYLGSEIDPSNDNPNLVLYDAKDLTTHAVIIGMTGSGKTGLGVCLLEDALLDGIPVIAVDPKGDMGNLLLTFPELKPEQFEPYIDAGEAEQSGLSITELAKQKAELWQKGLAKTHQSPERIANLRDAVDMNLFTPGATYGRPVSLLKALTAPNAQLKADKDLYRERIASATTGMLSLLGVDNDPLSREHILLNTLLEFYWDKGQDIALADLIAVIQNPPFKRIGVMDIETIYPAKDRLKLAMQLNNLLASPGFEAWTKGESLNAERLFFGDKGKPQLSVMNIAHLSQQERLFFVTMLLNEVLAWMRTQPGTGSLRAILYIDELFGYMPPLGNPPTKPLLLTLLKQARAYGLGIVLSTQNPVDLDYKGLSNTGTWFIGKLQTEQDRARVMDGLLSASENGFDKAELNEAFNQLGKRKFLMHNIHEETPVIMTTRWAMSYLSGPLSRKQIATLCQQHKTSAEAAAVDSAVSSEPHETTGVKHVNLPPEIKQYFLPPRQIVTDTGALVYRPALMGLLDIHYEDSKSDTHFSSKHVFITPFADGAIAVDWRNASEPFADRPEQLDLIDDHQPDGSRLLEPLSVAAQKGFYKDWEKALTFWVRQNRPLDLLLHPALKLYSQPNENESQFRQRIALQLREARDVEVEKLRQQFSKKLATLENKLQRAELKIQKETEQASGKTMNAIIGAGTAIFSAFFSRKKVSVTNARRLGSAISKAKGALNERDDIGFAKQQATTIQADIDTLSSQFEKEQQLISQRFETGATDLDSVQLYPKAAGVQVIAFGIAWQPGIVIEGAWQAV
ncbi:MAG: ATP-binding protein [Gammaproteobacteria bacterium]|nr:MAG: ATP-binding protein [Gammaproteobacteria bacterium]